LNRRRPRVAPAALVAGSSLWMATAGNAPLWRELHSLSLLRQPGAWLLAVALALMIAALLTALLSLLAWRWTLKPAIVLLLVVTAVGGHFMLAYHVVIDSTMIVTVLQTDRRESAALLGWGFALSLLWGVVLPGWVVGWLQAPTRPWPRQALRNAAMAATALAVFAGVVLAGFQPLASAMRNHKQLRYLLNPLNTLYAVADVAAQPLRRPRGPLTPLGLDAQLAPAPSAKPPLLVLVLGETGRSGNFALNGYPRPTTPELAREDVASFRNAWSCGTSTAASVPCMFSNLGREGFGARAHDSENLLDVLQHAGLAVLWLDNQAGCKQVCDRVAHASTEAAQDPKLCAQGECLDGVLLQGLDARIDALPAARRAKGVVLVLHQMGSHGPAYSRRSPPEYKRFLPECESINLQECSREQLVNAYDNSIAYTDHVLAATIAWLKQREAANDTAMVYVADHGESLGENNLYLHGMPYSLAPDVQKHVPWITWLSPGFRRRSGIADGCLRGRADERISHDHYFHSVLGLMQVQTTVYQRALDAYAPCAAPRPAR
jgi:lipid A ethanolaminephosphotransferase